MSASESIRLVHSLLATGILTAALSDAAMAQTPVTSPIEQKLARAVTGAISIAPSFRQLDAWLDAFNSGDRDRLKSYLAIYWPSANPDEQTDLRERTGGFDLLGLEKVTKTTVVATLRERSGEQYVRLTFVVDTSSPRQTIRLATREAAKP
jgi:hypothetical protein